MPEMSYEIEGSLGMLTTINDISYIILLNFKSDIIYYSILNESSIHTYYDISSISWR